jgi:hypothetical protein
MNPRLFPVLLRQPTMGGRGRVNNRSPRITEVSGERHQYRHVDKLLRRFATTRHFKCQHSAVATLLARRHLMPGIISQTTVMHPLHQRLLLQPCCQHLRVIGVRAHSEIQCLQTFLHHPGVEGAHGRTTGAIECDNRGNELFPPDQSAT